MVSSTTLLARSELQSMYKQFDFRFRYQMSENSSHATLFRYLSSRDTEFSLRPMIVWALSAFWYPLACKWSKQYSEADLKAAARHAIYELQQQISYLARTFGLEQELAAPIVSNGLSASSNRTTPAVGPLPAAAAHRFASEGTADSSTGVPKLMQGSDDDVLDQMFP